MKKIIQPENFNASLVPLEGSNLVEASAGTGKTYSIAILALRLFIEKKIPVNQILMVTFTKAAVAELEERLRMFIRTAYKASLGEIIHDDAIAKLVSDAIEKENETAVQQLLRTAIIFLDEISVLTIHSFCQQTLTGFAFETNQLFGAETMQDSSLVLTEETNKFWRENITTIPWEMLHYLVDVGLSRESISSITKEHINGKKYLGFDKEKIEEFSNHSYYNMLAAMKNLQLKEDEFRSHLYSYIEHNKDQIIDSSKGNAYVLKNILPDIDNPEVFSNAIWEKRELANVKKVFETTLLPQIQQCENAHAELNNHLQNVIVEINCFAISKISAAIENYKQRNNLLSFDDMIVNLHKALLHNNSSHLVAALRAKYKAVFIDEFQDTDRLQYEIFQKAFGEETILFYIGDPKQSIYAWRKADIFTYFKAKEQVNRQYNMNQNFRSSIAFIDAMNLFFLPAGSFDTFHFEKALNAIQYIPVESPKKNKKDELKRDNQSDVPISILPLSKKEEIENAVAAQVAELLSESYTIVKDGKERRVSAADIGILVRTNGEGQMIKDALAAKGIPAVTINDAKVLQSPEAVFMLYLLQAIMNLTAGNINKALLSPFTGYNVADILQLDDEKTIQLFRKYKAVWDEDGIYAALMQFMSDYNVRNVLLEGNSESGERIITNMVQLIELVHKTQNDKRFSPAELIGWLQRCIEGMETQGDQYEQRIESDEESVKIVTIHKSKGLEYKIVLAPFVDFLKERKQATFCSFRHPETGDYVTVEKTRITPQQKEWMDEQTEQENRRLLYVAITRGIYKCFIFQNTYYKSSTLATFVKEIDSQKQDLINFIEPPIAANFYAEKQTWQPAVSTTPVVFELAQKYWSRISYTMLAAKGEATMKPRNGKSTAKYDQFIFNELTKGAKTGNMLHHLFENINFASEQSWPYHIAQAIKKYAPRYEKEYAPMLQQLLQHVTQATIQLGNQSFSLASVPTEQRLNELEFDFNVPLFAPSVLQSFRNSGIQINVKHFEQVEGIMNGKVDMFFEHNGRYYILDWKSNYLGDNLQYYEPNELNKAMNESNYHLQYLIYTVTVKKYLQSRLPSFDYEQQFGGVIYMYVRGVRSRSQSGVFVTRPGLQQIEALENLVSFK